jgi:hypothetical protein
MALFFRSFMRFLPILFLFLAGSLPWQSHAGDFSSDNRMASSLIPQIPSLAGMCRTILNKSLKAYCIQAINFPGRIANDTTIALSGDVRALLTGRQELLDRQLEVILEPFLLTTSYGQNRERYWHNFSAIIQLLQWGAAPTVTNSDGHTVLHRAAAHNAVEALEAGIAAGCSVGATDNQNFTPLHVACKAGNLPAVTLLIAAQAEMGIGDSEGNTPLHLASWYDKPDCVAALLAAGADHTIANNSGLTALQYAVEHGFTQSAKILKYHQENSNE